MDLVGLWCQCLALGTGHGRNLVVEGMGDNGWAGRNG